MANNQTADLELTAEELEDVKLELSMPNIAPRILTYNLPEDEPDATV